MSRIRPIRLVTIIAGLHTGGAETMLLRFLPQLGAEFQSTVVNLGRVTRIAQDLEAAGVPVVSLGIRSPMDLPWAAARLRLLMRRIRPDCLQGWMYHGDWTASWLAGHQPRIPVVWTVRQSAALEQERPRSRWLVRQLARRSPAAHAIVYNSCAGRRSHEGIGFAPGRGRVIYSGYDGNAFSPLPGARDSVRTNLGLPLSTPLLGLVARDHPMKDVETALRAMALLIQRLPSARLLLVGRGLDQANTALWNRVMELQLSSHVIALGELPHIQPVLAALDLAFLSSRTEGLPNALAEAMACGVPCVGTAVGDVPLLLGDTGRIVPPQDPGALAAALLELLLLSPEMRSQLGAAARARILQDFSWRRMLDDFVGLYRELCDHAAPLVLASAAPH